MSVKVSLDYYLVPKSQRGEKLVLLFVVSEVVGLSSPNVFDSKADPTSFTNGHGSFYAVKTVDDMQAAEELLNEVDAALNVYIRAHDETRQPTTRKRLSAASAPPTTE